MMKVRAATMDRGKTVLGIGAIRNLKKKSARTGIQRPTGRKVRDKPDERPYRKPEHFKAGRFRKRDLK